MKTLFIDAKTGLSSDMLAASLLGFIEDKTTILHNIGVNLPKNYVLNLDSCFSYDNKGLKFTIKNTDYIKGISENNSGNMRHGYSYKEVLATIDNSGFSPKVKLDARGVYDIIAKAEMKVHNADFESLHLHEVGSPRAIFNILSCCYLIDFLGIEKIYSTPINVGYGTVICAHGEVSVPAPATKNIIVNIPTFSNEIKGELLTPTGAALIKYFVTEFNEISVPNNAIKSIGIGSRDIGCAGGVISYLY